MWLYDLKLARPKKFEILELTDAFAMLLRLHGEIKEAVGGGRQLLSLVFGLFSLHASLSDATSVRSIAKSNPLALLGGEQIPLLLDCRANRLQNKNEESCAAACLPIRPL